MAVGAACRTAADVNAHAISPMDVVDAALARIDELDERLCAFIRVDRVGAMAAADRVGRRVLEGASLPMAGVPIALKGRQSLGAPWAQRLRAAGAVVVGWTSVPPASGHQTWGLTERGPTRNPWDLQRTPGGSSAGAAVAVATGMVPVAVGADGGGSIRVPAAWCGVIGFKPTSGSIARRRDGVGLMALGPIARSIDDVRLFLEVATGRTDSRLPRLPLRAAWSSDVGYVDVDRDVAALARAAADRLAAAGVIEWTETPVRLEPMWGAWRVLHDLDGALADGKPLPDEFEIPLPEAIDQRARLDRTLAAVFADVDVIVTPTSAGVAHQIVDSNPPERLVELTAWVNIAGCPAISLPAGMTSGGLPVGVQIVAPRHDDASCLAVATAWEAAGGVVSPIDVHHRTPSAAGDGQ
jgi:Asp-tRNA(Asn)/Glu-tRNA(Gln) amidotransferase A subunit family amidase